MQKCQDVQGVSVCRLATTIFVAVLVAFLAGCAGGVPNATPHGGEAPVPGTYANLSFEDLPNISLERHKVNLPLQSSRRGLIRRIVRAPAGRVASDLLADAALWCAANSAETLTSTETQELANNIVDILTAEYKLVKPRNIRSYFCRAAGKTRVVLSAEGSEGDHPDYIVWITDAEVGVALPTIVADRLPSPGHDDLRKSTETKNQRDLNVENPKRSSAPDADLLSPDQRKFVADSQKKSKALDAEFAKLDQRMYRWLKKSGMKGPDKNAATAASVNVAEGLGYSSGLLSSADSEQLVGRTTVARLAYFASGACTLSAFRPYRQSAVDLRKVKWDIANRSVHTIKRHADSTGSPITDDGATVVRFNLLNVAMDVDSVNDAARVLKAAQVIALACTQPK